MYEARQNKEMVSRRIDGISRMKKKTIQYAKGSKIELDKRLKDRSINVAIVGETHNEIDNQKEQKYWENQGICLYYENNTIVLNSKYNVTPDKIVDRIKFATLFLYDTIECFSKSNDGRMIEMRTNSKQYSPILERISYLIDTLLYDINREIFRLNDNMETNQEKELFYKYINAKKCCDLLRFHIDDILKEHSFPKNDNINFSISDVVYYMNLVLDSIMYIYNDLCSQTSDDYRIIRSRNMLNGAKAISKIRSRVIYKIGEKHIDDIINLPHNTISIIHKSEYLNDYKAQIESLNLQP